MIFDAKKNIIQDVFTYNHTSLLQICDLNVKTYIVSIVIHVYKLNNPLC